MKSGTINLFSFPGLECRDQRDIFIIGNYVHFKCNTKYDQTWSYFDITRNMRGIAWKADLPLV